MNKNDILDFIQKNRVFSLATCADNVPHVRKMFLVSADEKRLIFNVKKYKPVHAELKANPNVELCFYDPKEGLQVRIHGKAKFMVDEAMSRQIVEDHPDLQKQVDKYGDDVIVLYGVEDWRAKYWSRENKEASIEIA